MRLSLVIILAAFGLTALGSSPAHAKDSVVTRDTQIENIYPLDGDLVYRRGGNPAPERTWMASFHGHVHRARGIPAGAGQGDIGRDAKGRKVFTFAVAQFK